MNVENSISLKLVEGQLTAALWVKSFGSLITTEKHKAKFICAEAFLLRSSAVIGLGFTVNFETSSFHNILSFSICGQENSFEIINHGHIAHDDLSCREHGDDTLLLTLVSAEVASLVASVFVISEVWIRVDHCTVAHHRVSYIVVESMIFIVVVSA